MECLSMVNYLYHQDPAQGQMYQLTYLTCSAIWITTVQQGKECAGGQMVPIKGEQAVDKPGPHVE